MKHLFYIHSYITYFVSLGVIEHEKLAPGNCVFLYGRQFRPATSSPGINEVELPFTHHPVNSFSVERKFWRGWKKLAGFDRFLKDLVREDRFKLYTNQTGIDFIRLFISHEHCAGFSFLEEGMYSYYSLDQINREICPSGSSTLIFKVLLLFNFLGRLSPRKWFYNRAYDHVYSVSEAAFPGFERKVIIRAPFHNSFSLPYYGHILALDATAEYGVTSLKSMLGALEEVLQYLMKSGVNRLWVKYHPEQASNVEVKQRYEQVFKRYDHSLTVEEVPQHISLELVAGNDSNVDTIFYVFLSSVGLYAGLCGREVYSFASYITKLDQQYKQQLKLVPDAFKERVKFL